MLGVTVQLPARKTLFPVQIARNREMLRLFWVMWIYYKDTCEVRSQDSVSWFAQSCSAHNGNIVQNKAATLLSEQSAMLMIQFFVISAVFLWLCFSCQPPLFSFFLMCCYLRASVCSLFYGYCSICCFIFKLFSNTLTCRSWLELYLTGNEEGRGLIPLLVSE